MGLKLYNFKLQSVLGYLKSLNLSEITLYKFKVLISIKLYLILVLHCSHFSGHKLCVTGPGWKSAEVV